MVTFIDFLVKHEIWRKNQANKCNFNMDFKIPILKISLALKY